MKYIRGELRSSGLLLSV